MTNRLPSFATSLVWLVVLATGSLVALKALQPGSKFRIPLLASTASSSSDGLDDATSPPESSSGESPQPGQPLIAAAARRLYESRALEARIRQRVDLFGQQFTGSGHYRQWGSGELKRLKLELKFQVADQVASLQQVSDGRFFWNRRDLPNNAGLSRVDLRRIQETMSEPNAPPPAATLHSWMMLGGLAKLLHGLERNFLFSDAEPRLLQDTPVWRIVGHWRPAALAQLMPEQADILARDGAVPIERLPAHLPDTVVVVLGRDEQLPLFPYRIEYRRSLSATARKIAEAEAGASGSALTPTTEIATIELFEVNPQPRLGPEDFSYNPGEQVVQDDTDRFLTRLWNAARD